MGYASLKLFDKGDTAFYMLMLMLLVPAILTRNERHFGRACWS